MTQDKASDRPSNTYHYIHLTSEQLEHLPPDELLQACREYRSLLSIIMGVLYTPTVGTTVRVVASDLLYTQAQHTSQDSIPEGAEQVTYIIKEVSERLGLRPQTVRTAYEQLEKLGALHIDERWFPPQREQQLPLSLDAEGL